MRKSFISVFAQLSLASDMLTKKKKIKYGIYKNDTELSKYICGLKRINIYFKIYWEVIKRAQPVADVAITQCTD